MDDPVSQQHWAIAMAETVYVAGCTCPFCARHAEIGDDAVPAPSPTRPRSALPSTSGVVQVLYPPSYLGVHSPYPDPPPYPSSDSRSSPIRNEETSPLISSPGGTPLSRTRPDPLAQGSSLTGVPSQGMPSGRALLVEPNPPIITPCAEDTEPLPAYSRFDQRRPRFPVASDVLGPYPPLPVLSHTAQ